jgi:hypothetical protein
VFGLDTHMKEEENAKFKALFKIPFYKNNQNKIL